MAACHLGAPDAGGAAPPGAGGKKPPTHPLLPFVLIQGPPGTGKTHTVKASGGGVCCSRRGGLATCNTHAPPLPQLRPNLLF